MEIKQELTSFSQAGEGRQFTGFQGSNGAISSELSDFQAKSFSFCVMRAAALNVKQKTLTSRPLANLRGIYVACIAKVQLLPRLSRQVGMSVQAESECIYLSLISKKIVAAVKFMKIEEHHIRLYRSLQLNINNHMTIVGHLSLGGFPVSLAKNEKSHLENRK